MSGFSQAIREEKIASLIGLAFVLLIPATWGFIRYQDHHDQQEVSAVKVIVGKAENVLVKWARDFKPQPGVPDQYPKASKAPDWVRELIPGNSLSGISANKRGDTTTLILNYQNGIYVTVVAKDSGEGHTEVFRAYRQ